MNTLGGERANDDDRPAAEQTARRWVCPCSVPPILLATVEGDRVNLKIRDRYYHIEGVQGRVRATCPRCGREHTLTLRSSER